MTFDPITLGQVHEQNEASIDLVHALRAEVEREARRLRRRRGIYTHRHRHPRAQVTTPAGDRHDFASLLHLRETLDGEVWL